MTLGNIEPPDYDAREQELSREYVLEVSALLANNDSDLLKKIDTYVNRFGYTYEQVRKKIRTDAMFAASFAKEARRTGFHEEMAAQWLTAFPSVQDLTTLPKSGVNALYVTGDGEVRRGGDIQGRGRPSKSLDFRWRTGTTTCYAMHKYTREGGGNQDSQYNEMEKILHQFYGCQDEGCILIVIVDGPYYTPQRMAALRRFTSDHAPRSYAVHIQDVPGILEGYHRPPEET